MPHDILLKQVYTLNKDEGIEVSNSWLDTAQRNDDEWCEFVETESIQTSVFEGDASNGINSSENTGSPSSRLERARDLLIIYGSRAGT